MTDTNHGSALSNLVAGIGDANFADRLMLAFNALCAADMCSGFAIEGNRPNALFAVSMDPKRSAFAHIATLRYVQKYWKRDTIASSTLGRAHRSVQTIRRPSSVIRDLDYRHECYAEGEVVERISIYKAGTVPIIANAYRLRASGAFSQDQIERLEALSPIVVATIDKHRQLVATSRQPAPLPDPDSIAMRLRGLDKAALSEREVQVLAYILAGTDQGTIAREIGVEVSTVVTYRRRGYAKFGVRNKSELRAIVANGLS